MITKTNFAVVVRRSRVQTRRAACGSEWDRAGRVETLFSYALRLVVFGGQRVESRNKVPLMGKATQRVESMNKGPLMGKAP